MHVLVTAASKHGATREIAAAIAAGLQQRGLGATTRPAESVDGFAGCDAVVLGSAVYAGHWLEPAHKLAEDHAAALAARPVWLFSSGPIGSPDPMPEGDPVNVAQLMEATGANAHRIFAGKLDKSALGFAERALVAALRAPEGDFRDWAAIDAFAGEIAERLTALAAAGP